MKKNRLWWFGHWLFWVWHRFSWWLWEGREKRAAHEVWKMWFEETHPGKQFNVLCEPLDWPTWRHGLELSLWLEQRKRKE